MLFRSAKALPQSTFEGALAGHRKAYLSELMGVSRGTTSLQEVAFTTDGLYVEAVSDTGRKARVNFSRRTAGCDCPSSARLKQKGQHCKHVLAVFDFILGLKQGV